MKLQDVPILVVDDVNAMRLQIQELLQRVGFEIIFLACNGAEALDVLQKESSVRLILADLHMEPINGLDLLTVLKANKQNQNLAYIMITADSTKDKVVKSIQAGVDDYLVKPLTLDMAHTKIIKALMKKKVIS